MPDTGNAAQLDLVAALEWVRDNIANFGGDPRHVMLFGQSGGAGKIATLMAMPAAKGLFHRASLQSGAQYAAIPKARAQARTGKVLANLGLGPTQVDELHRVPADRLLQASVGTGIAFSPVVDGVTLPHMPFEPGAPDLAADVPVLIGTTETEGTYNAADLVEMDDAEMRARLGAPDVLGGNAGRIIEIFRRRRPHAHTGRAVPHDPRGAHSSRSAGGEQGGSGRSARLPLADQLADAGAATDCSLSPHCPWN